MNKFLTFGWILVQPVWFIYLRLVKGCNIESKVRLSYLSRLEGRNKLGQASKFIQSSLGYASYLGEQCYFYNTQIGKYSCIGPRVKTCVGQHPINNFASVHPAFYSKKTVCGFSYVARDKFQEYKCCEGTDKSVVIGNDVWIGSDALIMEGVQIGDGAVIGAGSVVLHDVLPYTIVAGVPARCIKTRFESEIVEHLLKNKWWDKGEEWIAEHANAFDDVQMLLKSLKVNHDTI